MFDALKNLKKKAEGLAETHSDKIAQGVEKVGDFVDTKTSGKHSDKIDGAVGKAQGYVEKLGDKDGKDNKDDNDGKGGPGVTKG
ncbi:antitoxin [Streptomyces profundus]|uniref:antitoxin n=1 Tax=Streptomyces profundus TaxID=2867410 RepID=UPI001D1606C1|nr:antitoxin [Streptomyces sp. MA3_2.13]UED88152.1 antitoxin [Streptomyces sp. MA3_2.13]